VSSFLDRRCISDYKLPAPSGKGTVILPAGTGIFITVLGLQNDPNYFPEPEKFDPEHFTEENKQSRPSYTYFPFGEGPRMCIGKNKYINIHERHYEQKMKLYYCNEFAGSISRWKFITLKSQYTTVKHSRQLL
jgi:hypothetical protein